MLVAARARCALCRPGVRRVAAGGHAAALFVRRDPVLLLPAIALVRPRRVVRERVPVLLRSRDRAVGRVSRDVPRAETAAGRRINFGTMGCAILWSPFYAVGDVGGARDARGGTRRRGGRVLEAVRRGGRVRLGGLRVRRDPAVDRRGAARHGRPSALAAGLAVWLGTPLLFYMYVAPPFSHACSAFAVALFVTVWLHVRRDMDACAAPSRSARRGALMAMVREQDVFFVAGPALDFGLTGRSGGDSASRRVGEHSATRRDGLRRWRHRRVRGVRARLCRRSSLAYNALNGHPGPSTRRHAQDDLVLRRTRCRCWSRPSTASSSGRRWRSSRSRGWSMLAPDARGTPAATRRDRRSCVLLMVALQVYVSGSVESWTVAGAFGQRRFVGAHDPARDRARGAAVVAARRVAAARRHRRMAVLCVWWNLALIAEFGTGLMDRQRLELRKNAYDAFVTLPRMAPGLAYRYLVDRDVVLQAATARTARITVTSPCASCTSPTSASRWSAPTASRRWRRAMRWRRAGTT